MKKILIVIVVLFTLLASCSLDESPYKTNAEQLATDPNGAEQLVTGIYGAFWSSYMMKKTYQEWLDMDHDLNSAPDWVMNGAGMGNVTPHWAYNADSDLFKVFYMIILRSNKAKEALEASDLDDPRIGQRYGEVMFLRAFSYFHLVRMYGPVPLRLQSNTPDDISRSPVADVYDVVTNDLQTAIKYLHYPESGYVGEWGHVDRTAARILLARVYNTMASGKLAGQGVRMNVNIMNQSGEDTRYPKAPLELKEFTTQKVMGDNMDDGYSVFDHEELYKLAIEQCDSVIKRRGIDFDLLPSWGDIWGSTNYRNKEFVWGIASYDEADYRAAGGSYYYTPSFVGGGGYTISLSDACWEMYNWDKNSAQNDERATLGVYHYYKNAGGEDGAEPNRQWYRFPSGDLRYDQPYDNLKPEHADSVLVIDGPPVAGLREAAYSTKWHFLDINDLKAVYKDGRIKGEGLIKQDIILIRFSEIYLLRAEAYNEIGRGVEALADLNTIRDRVKAKPYITTDQVELRSWIFQERGLEFTQEFMRKFDLLRWGMYLNVMNATELLVNASGQSIIMAREPRSVLFAVPTDEVQQNKLFGPNNPGWN